MILDEYIVIYGVISNIDNDVSIAGPYYGGNFFERLEATQKAKQLANTKTKNVIIPWVMQTQQTIPYMMKQARKTWFAKFRQRTYESAQILNRTINTCPFNHIDFHKETELLVSYR